MATVDYKAKARARAAQLSDSAWLKLKEGDNGLRLLPTPDELWMEYNLHRDVGPKKQTVRCGIPIDPAEKGKCWLCNRKIPELRAAGKEGRAAALEPKPEFVVQVAKVSEEGQFSGPYLFRASKTVAAQLLNVVIGSKKRKYEDPKKGYNFSIHRTGTGKNDTRYSALEADEEPSEVPAAILKKLKPFSEVKEIPKYDEAKQKAAYFGRDTAAEPEDEDEEETPRARVAAGGKRKRHVEPPEELEETEEEEDEEEETGEDDEDEEVGEEEEEETEEDEESEDAEDEVEEEEEEEETEEEPEPPKKKPGKTGKGKSKPKPEPEEEETEDEEVEEEEEDEGDEVDEEELPPPPPPKKKKTPPAPAKPAKKTKK